MKWHNLGGAYKPKIDQMRAQEPFELLGVSRDADLATVKRAYIRLMKLYHPDKNDKFLEGITTEYAQILNAAFERVKAELKR